MQPRLSPRPVPATVSDCLKRVVHPLRNQVAVKQASSFVRRRCVEPSIPQPYDEICIKGVSASWASSGEAMNVPKSHNRSTTLQGRFVYGILDTGSNHCELVQGHALPGSNCSRTLCNWEGIQFFMPPKSKGSVHASANDQPTLISGSRPLAGYHHVTPKVFLRVSPNLSQGSQLSVWTLTESLTAAVL